MQQNRMRQNRQNLRASYVSITLEFHFHAPKQQQVERGDHRPMARKPISRYSRLMSCYRL